MLPVMYAPFSYHRFQWTAYSHSIYQELTLADLYHLPGGSLLPILGINVIQEKKNVARWWNDISSRASWQKIKDGLPGTA
jgi:hypothetical protein